MENNTNTAESKTVQLCTFWLSGRLFGVNILDVKEVNSENKFTPIYHAAPEVEGYVNIRGQIYLIADMKKIIGFEKKQENHDKWLVIFKESITESFGIIVDQIGDVVEVTEKDIVDRRTNEKEAKTDVEEKRKDIHNIGAGICKLKDNLIVVINSANIINKIEMHKNQNK